MGKKAGYIVAIIVNLMLLYVINSAWQSAPFLTDGFSRVLSVFNLSIYANILANVLFVVYDGKYFRGPVKFLLNLVGIYFLYVLYIVFPFNLPGDFLNNLLKLMLVLGIAVTAVATVFELIFTLSRKGKIK